MAVVTRNAIDVHCVQKNVTSERTLFGRTREVVTNTRLSTQIHKYYVLYKDDNDEVLQSIVDSINRIRIDIGTDFDKLAMKALESQPEYVEHKCGLKTYKIHDVYYKLLFCDGFIEFTPLYYWLYSERDIIPVEVSDLDKGDVTKDIKDFIDSLKERYPYYVRLYESVRGNK